LRFKRGTWCAVVVVVTAMLACAPEASAQLDQWGFWENGVTEHWWLSSEDFKAEDATTAVARWEQIGAAKDARAWAGDYFRGGETHGTYLRWSPSAGFVIAHVDKCAARVMGLVYGRVEATPELVQFFPELDKQSAGAHGGHHGGGTQHAAAPRAVLRFVPVEWRGARLLIAEGEMGDFGDYVAGLGEYNGYDAFFILEYNPFFSRSVEGAEEKKEEDGGGAPPVVPPGYERFIKKPIEARITSVGRRDLKTDYTIEGEHTSQTFTRASVTHVTINAGTEQGVKERIVFRVARPAEGDTVFILRAGPRTSTAIVVRDVDERGAETFYDSEIEKRHSKVARGWRLTTSLYD
jgi:hypothetical protein